MNITAIISKLKENASVYIAPEYNDSIVINKDD